MYKLTLLHSNWSMGFDSLQRPSGLFLPRRYASTAEIPSISAIGGEDTKVLKLSGSLGLR